MRKIVTTEMLEKAVRVSVVCCDSSSAEGGQFAFTFPFSVVNPRIALQIATLLVSDPTIPSTDEKES